MKKKVVEGVLKIVNNDERDEVAKILFKNGYEVVKKKRKVGKRVEYDISYRLEEEDGE